MSSPQSPVPGRGAFIALVLAGLLGNCHAGWSVYWAVGGPLLLDGFGRFTIVAPEMPVPHSPVAFIIIVVAKVLIAWVPLAVEKRRLPGRRLWRPFFWLAGFSLLIGGSVTTAYVGLQFVGWVGSPGPDGTVMVSNALLWDAVFALWGAALVTGLMLSRDRTPSDLSPARA